MEFRFETFRQFKSFLGLLASILEDWKESDRMTIFAEWEKGVLVFYVEISTD